MKALRQPRLMAALHLPVSSDGQRSIMEERSSTQEAMPDSDPLWWNAPTIAAAVRAKRADPVEVVDAFLAQIRRANPAVNALVDHDEAAPRAEAAEVRRRVAAGEALPLAGVPVVVKDSIWVAGRRITQGSPLFREFRPGRDALPVERMRQAGAVVIGIGNMPEFGAKEVTDNRLYGRTLNPRDLSRTPGWPTCSARNGGPCRSCSTRMSACRSSAASAGPAPRSRARMLSACASPQASPVFLPVGTCCCARPSPAWPGLRTGWTRRRWAGVRRRIAATPLFNHARTPAISIPCGAGRDGLPVGLQVVGPRLADWRVLTAAAAMERALAGG